MIDVPLVWRFAVLVAVLSCIPGPAVLLTVATALRRGSRPGLAAACGVLSGNALYFTLSGAGVAALLLASYAAFTVLKYAGAAYLAYLGLKSLFARRSDALEAASGAPAAADARRAYRAGLVTQLSNPKALVFFVAIVPQFVDAHRPFAVQIAALTIVSTVVEFIVLAVYVRVATRVRRMPRADRASLWFERAGGAALLLVAATIAREPVGER
jgi:homoserine/homoserine lactone efflux protein